MKKIIKYRFDEKQIENIGLLEMELNNIIHDMEKCEMVDGEDFNHKIETREILETLDVIIQLCKRIKELDGMFD